MSIFTHPSKVFDHFKSWFTDEAQQVLTFIKPTVKMLERDGRKALIAASVSAVAQMASTDLSNGDKREQALKLIEGSLAAAGMAFIESEARATIEMALQALKAAA